MVWGGVSFDIDIDYWKLTFDLSIDVENLWVVVVGVGVPYIIVSALVLF